MSSTSDLLHFISPFSNNEQLVRSRLLALPRELFFSILDHICPISAGYSSDQDGPYDLQHQFGWARNREYYNLLFSYLESRLKSSPIEDQRDVDNTRKYIRELIKIHYPLINADQSLIQFKGRIIQVLLFQLEFDNGYNLSPGYYAIRCWFRPRLDLFGSKDVWELLCGELSSGHWSHDLAVVMMWFRDKANRLTASIFHGAQSKNLNYKSRAVEVTINDWVGNLRDLASTRTLPNCLTWWGFNSREHLLSSIQIIIDHYSLNQVASEL